MARSGLCFGFAFLASVQLACTSTPNVPPTQVTPDAPTADASDSTSNDRPDVSPLDVSDVSIGMDRSDGGEDVPAMDVLDDVRSDSSADTGGELPPTDGPSAVTWCDLPVAPGMEVRGVTLPAGFCVRRYGRITQPRVLAFSPTGDLFVSSPGMGAPGGTGPGESAIVVLPDDNHDGVADRVARYVDTVPGVPGLSDLVHVHGLLFANDALYFTVESGVFRVPFRAGDRALAAGVTPTAVASLTDSVRWTHTLARGADGTIYVSMGNYGLFACPAANPRQGSVLAIGTGHPMDGDVVARGFRNPMYIRCQPWGCYGAELTDDGWRDPAREKIFRFESGQDYGYPCCYDRALPSPANVTGVSCASVTPSLVGFTVGYTPFGHDFEHGGWPAPYANALFIGLHGAVGSWTATGIRWAPVNPTTHEFMTSMATEFLTGWGRGTPNEGRVADLAFAPDGRLFFTDDQLGQVYWIAPTTLRMPAR